jgi:hypothetical protein
MRDKLEKLLDQIFAYGVDWTEHKDKSEYDHDTSMFAAKIKAQHKEALLTSIINLVDKEQEPILDALYWMYIQYCSKGHLFMGAGESASEILEDAGYIVVDTMGEILKDNGDSEEQRAIIRSNDE